MENDINKRVVMITIMLGSFLTPFMGSSVVVALPSIGKEFALNAGLINWIATSFILTTAVFVVPCGKFADIYGRKKILFYGLLIFTLSSVLCGLSINTFMLISFRALQGVGGAMISATVIAIITSVYSPGERGKAIGINVAAIYTGLSIGPVVGGIVTQHFGWRILFFMMIPLGLIVIILLSRLKQEWSEAKGERMDYKGSLIYGVGLLCLMCGLSFIRNNWYGIGLIIVGCVILIIFCIYETKIINPILDISLFKKSRILMFSSIAALINYSATYAVSFLLSLYLQYVKGFNPEQAGLILVVQPVIQALFSPLSGKLSDRVEAQKVASFGMALSTVGLLVLCFLKIGTNISVVLITLVVLGFGFALFSSPNTNAVMNSVEKRYYGVASGILGAARTIGQTVSMGITSLILTLFLGNTAISSSNNPSFIHGFTVSFVVFTIMCFLGIFASLARGKVKL